MKKRVIKCENPNNNQVIYIKAEGVRKAREILRNLGIDDSEYHCFPYAKKYIRNGEVIEG